MDWITSISFDDIGVSVLIFCAIRSLLVILLPDEIAGPGGWLLDTGPEGDQA